MDDTTAAARLALLEAHVDWLYQNAGYAPPYGHDGSPPATGAGGGQFSGLPRAPGELRETG